MIASFRTGALALTTAAFLAGTAHAENVKIAYIDPVSGPLGLLGENGLQAFRVSEEIYQARKDADKSNTLEFVAFDNKANPQETLLQFKAAVDQGIRYVTQGVGSGAAGALLDAVNKHNERNPGKEVIYVSWGSNDPALTNEKCSFWHFRMDAHSEMKVEALTTYMAKDPKIKKLYLINQNFVTGQSVSKLTKEYLARKRPDIQIVGDDLIPLGQVKDFSPYVAKIRATGADSIVTSSFGNDLTLLIKAAKEADLKVDFYTMFANAPGAPAAMGAVGEDRLKLIAYYHPNIEGFTGAAYTEVMNKKYGKDFLHLAASNGVEMLHQGFRDAKSTDALKVAYAMEGMKFKGLTGEMEMRKSDHQMLLPLYVANWTKVNGKDVKYDQEKTGYGWKTVQKLDSYVSAQPTSCQMKRPSGT